MFLDNREHYIKYYYEQLMEQEANLPSYYHHLDSLVTLILFLVLF